MSASTDEIYKKQVNEKINIRGVCLFIRFEYTVLLEGATRIYFNKYVFTFRFVISPKANFSFITWKGNDAVQFEQCFAFHLQFYDSYKFAACFFSLVGLFICLILIHDLNKGIKRSVIDIYFLGFKNPLT